VSWLACFVLLSYAAQVAQRKLGVEAARKRYLPQTTFAAAAACVLTVATYLAYAARTPLAWLASASLAELAVHRSAILDVIAALAAVAGVAISDYVAVVLFVALPACVFHHLDCAPTNYVVVWFVPLPACAFHYLDCARMNSAGCQVVLDAALDR